MQSLKFWSPFLLPFSFLHLLTKLIQFNKMVNNPQVLLFDPPLGIKTSITVDSNQLQLQGWTESLLDEDVELKGQDDNESSTSTSNPNSTFNLYFAAHLQNQGEQKLEDGTRLQVWTDLPILDPDNQKQEGSWKALDLDQSLSSSGSKRKTLFAKLPISASTLTKASSPDSSLPHTVSYQYTYRFQHSDGSFTWLGEDNNNGVIELFLPFDGYDQLLVESGGKEPITKERRLRRFKSEIRLIEDEDIDIIEFNEGNDEKGIESLVLGITSHDEREKKDVFRLSKGKDVQGLVIERTKAAWHTSRTFNSIKDLSQDFNCSLIVLKLPLGGFHQIAVLLPLHTQTSSTSLIRGQDENTIAANINSRGNNSSSPNLVVVIGKEHQLHQLMKTALQAASKFVYFKSQLSSKPSISKASPLHPSNGLGLCTWEAIGPNNPPKVSKVLSILSSLENRFGEGAITSLLIDDGWAMVARPDSQSRGTLLDWELDERLLDVEIPSDLVNGGSKLSQYISIIKTQFPSIKQVGVWSTLAGYWDGISEEGGLASRFGPLETYEMKNPFDSNSSTRTWKLPEKGKLGSFWSETFKNLKSAGVDFVKVDAQAEFELLSSSSSESLGDFMWEKMMAAAEENLGPDSVIHCMAFGTQGGWINGSRGLGSQMEGKMTTFRATDDYFPNIPSAHRFHIAHNVYHSLLLSHTPSLLPDSDMFTSFTKGDKLSVEWARHHSAFRSFSTSHLWLSDSDDTTWGESKEMIQHLLARSRNADGSLGSPKVVQAGCGNRDLVNLMASRSLPLASSIFDDSLGSGHGKPTKLFFSNPSTKYNSTIGIWNTREGEVLDTLTSRDVSDALLSNSQGGSDIDLPEIAVFSSSSNTYTKLSGLEVKESKKHARISSQPLFATHLSQAEFEIVRLAPVLCLSTIFIAYIGLLDNYSGLSTISNGLKQVERQAEQMEPTIVESETAILSTPSTPIPTNSTSSIPTYSNWIIGLAFRVFESFLSHLPQFLLSSSFFISFQKILRQNVRLLLSPGQTASKAESKSIDTQSPPSKEDLASSRAPSSQVVLSQQVDPISSASIDGKEEVIVQVQSSLAGRAGFILQGVTESQLKTMKIYLDGFEVLKGLVATTDLKDCRGKGTEKAYLVEIDMVKAVSSEKNSGKEHFGLDSEKLEDAGSWTLNLAIEKV